jgi:hypothetical protein
MQYLNVSTAEIKDTRILAMAVETSRGCTATNRIRVGAIADRRGCLQPSSAPVRCVTDRVAGVAPKRQQVGWCAAQQWRNTLLSAASTFCFTGEYMCGGSIHCCSIEQGKDACGHSTGMSMPVNASKDGTSQLIDSQRSEVNTSAGTMRYRRSSGGIACDRGSPCSALCNSTS